MNYSDHGNFNLNDSQRIGILLVNLGTPKAPTTKAVRQYLAEFLWDPRIVEFPRALWWLILHGVILRLRPRYSAKLYQSIWTADGSPLLVNSQKQAEGLQNLFNQFYPDKIDVVLAMRYGSPSIADGLAQFRKFKINQILVLPLYPQYAGPSTGSAFDAIADALKKWRRVPDLHFIDHYADHSGYIQALTQSIHDYWQTHTRGDKLLFSFHGIPQYHIIEGDPYYHLCHKTACLVAEKLKLKKNQWLVVFQSRFGHKEWLRPYCNETLKELAQQGIKNIDIICPGFAADCLETLEEIAQRNREIFLHAGGENYQYIPALNDNKIHLHALANIILKHLHLPLLDQQHAIRITENLVLQQSDLF